MITVAVARNTARARLESKCGTWVSLSDDAPTVLTIPLHPPTEKQMRADEAAAESWTREWAEVESGGLEVDWTVRSWRSIGSQRVPVRARLRRGDDVARFVGGRSQQQWRRLQERTTQLRTRFGVTVGIESLVRANVARILGFDDDAFATLLDVAEWLAKNSVAGLRPRQLPIRGVDSKWFGVHRGILTAIVVAATGSSELGIIDGERLIRVRVLDPALALDGVADFAAPPSQLDALKLAPRVVFVFENLECVLAMPAWPGAVVVHGSGYTVDTVARLTWVHPAPVVYWGDLDSHGFAILDRLRAWHPVVSSVLMDARTLAAHRDLCVPEPTPHRGALSRLTPGEQAALHALRDGDLRLEQERIPWHSALAALNTAMSAQGTSESALHSG